MYSGFFVPDPLYESASVDPLVEDNPAAHAHAEAGRAMKPVDLPMRTKLRPITAHLHAATLETGERPPRCQRRAQREISP